MAAMLLACSTGASAWRGMACTCHMISFIRPPKVPSQAVTAHNKTPTVIKVGIIPFFLQPF